MLFSLGLLFVGSGSSSPELLSEQVIEGRCFALSRLAEALKVKVSIPGSLNRQVVFLRTGGARPEESLKMVSHSLGCTVDKVGGEWRIVKTPASAAEEGASDLLLREKAYTVLLQDLQEKKAGSPADWLKRLTEADDQGYLDASFVPSAWLVRELLSMLGPKELAKMEPYSPSIWSLHPTLAESALPASAAGALRQYGELNRALGHQMDLAPDKRWQTKLNSQSVRQAIYPKPVVQVRLIAGLWQSMFRATVMLFDADGKVIDSASTDEALSGMTSLDLRILPIFAGDSSLIPSERVPFVKSMSLQAGLPLPVPQAKGALLELNEEPLDASIGAFLTAAGQTHSRAICAPLPDGLHQVTLSKPPATSHGLFQLLADQWVVFEPKPGWLVGRMGYRRSWLGRLNLDRPQMKRWLANGGAEGMEWFREECLLASASQEGILANSLDDWWRMSVLSSLRPAPLPSTPNIEIQMLRALGGLSATDWSKALQGEPVDIRPGSKIAGLIYECTRGYLVLTKKSGPELSDWAKSGTASLERGLPPGTTIRFALRVGRSLVNSRWGRAVVPLDILSGNIGYLIKDLTEAEVNNVLTGPHTIGTQGRLTISVDFGEGLVFERSLDLEGMTPLKENVHFLDWPQDWKDRLMTDLRRRMEAGAGNASGRPPQ